MPICVEAEQPFCPVVLEDEHEHAVGSGDGEQVEQDRLDRDTSERKVTSRSRKASTSTKAIT